MIDLKAAYRAVIDLGGKRNGPVIEFLVLYIMANAAAVMLNDVTAKAAALACVPVIGLIVSETRGSSCRTSLALMSVVLSVYGGLLVSLPMWGLYHAPAAPYGEWLKQTLAVQQQWRGGLILAMMVPLLVMIGRAMPIRVERYRARGGVLGDARWATMRQIAEVFPSNGDIVFGELYRPDLERSGSRFKPGDVSTWGSGGRAKLVTFKNDFTSGHMMFFAGSGTFKTTGVVIPTARVYGGGRARPCQGNWAAGRPRPASHESRGQGR